MVTTKVMEQPRLTERLAQDAVYQWCFQRKHELAVPNCGAVGWGETDLISVNKNRFAHAFEIKTSRADWLAELRKIAQPGESKHWRDKRMANAGELERLLNENDKRRAEHFEIQGKNEGELGKYVRLDYETGIAMHRDAGPNYFWIVAPEDVVDDHELPEYAGLMTIAWHPYAGRYQVQESTPAPRLHRRKLDDWHIMTLARGLSLRFWGNR